MALLFKAIYESWNSSSLGTFLFFNDYNYIQDECELRKLIISTSKYPHYFYLKK